jgi:hypothetical protein
MFNRKTLASSLLALALGAGCAAPKAFSTSFPVNREDALKAALAQARAHPRGPARPVVVGVTNTPRGVFAYDVAQKRMLWNQPLQVSGVPLSAGNFVVVPEGEHIRVRALDTGSVVLDVPRQGMNLVGADSDGQLTAIALSTGGSMGARSRLLLIDGTSVRFNEQVSHPLGGPAVLGGLAFVPNNRVHLSILDAMGTELARVRIRDDVASQALAREDDVYFGLQGMYLLDEKTPKGLESGASYFRMKRTDPLPGQPRFLPDTTLPPQPPESAVHRVSLSFAPAEQGGVAMLADDSAYLLFYRQLYALEPHQPRARWVHQTQADVVGVRAVPGGVLLVDEQGTLTTLHADGSVQSTVELGVKPVVASIRAEQVNAGSRSSDPPPLALMLFEAALNPDARLVPARAMAVGLLAGLDDSDATHALIELCQDREGPDRVRRAACVALGKRTIGSEAVVAALGVHADYLADKKAPPVGPLADAALHSEDARATAALVSHLEDPATSVEELSSLMLALKGLADPSVAEPVAAFLRLYHADADDQRMADALVIAVETLAKVQGKAAENVLEPIANDALGAPTVRSAAARVLATLAPVPDESPKEGEKAKEPAPAEPVPEGPPARLTSLHVDRALAPMRDELKQCVRKDEKRPMSARVTIVVEGDGTVSLVQTLPESLKACVEPLVRKAKFPETTWQKRDTLSTTITR